MNGLADLDWIAVFAAGAAGFAFGALYYTMLGKSWMSALGKTEDEVKEHMGKSVFIRAIVGQIVIAVVLSILIAGDAGLTGALGTALIVWVGVVMTTMGINHGFQGKPLSLTLIDGGHWLGVFAVQGILIGYL